MPCLFLLHFKTSLFLQFMSHCAEYQSCPSTALYLKYSQSFLIDISHHTDAKLALSFLVFFPAFLPFQLSTDIPIFPFSWPVQRIWIVFSDASNQFTLWASLSQDNFITLLSMVFSSSLYKTISMHPQNNFSQICCVHVWFTMHEYTQ